MPKMMTAPPPDANHHPQSGTTVRDVSTTRHPSRPDFRARPLSLWVARRYSGVPTRNQRG
jgi:hypothetical protein